MTVLQYFVLYYLLRFTTAKKSLFAFWRSIHKSTRLNKRECKGINWFYIIIVQDILQALIMCSCVPFFFVLFVCLKKTRLSKSHPELESRRPVSLRVSMFVPFNKRLKAQTTVAFLDTCKGITVQYFNCPIFFT